MVRSISAKDVFAAGGGDDRLVSFEYSDKLCGNDR